MRYLIYIFLFFTIGLNAQIASVKTVKYYATNTEDAQIRFFLDDFQVSNLTVNYTISGATSKVDIVNGSITFSASEISKDVVISKTATAIGTENLTVTITASVNYSIDSFNSATNIMVSETLPPLAFPSARGAGAYTSGGRGGTVIHVTNLNNSGAGSLREALLQTYPRIIVFDVSGTIDLTSPIYLDNTHSNVTIAGQTAPEGGITIEGQAIGFFKTENVIFRYVRIVSKHWLQTSTNAAAITFSGGNNVIVDHISARYVVGTSCISTQEDNDTNNGQGQITIQKSLFGDSTTGMLMGAIVQHPRNTYAGTNSCLNNFFINISHRFPNVSGNADAESINNVVYNYLNRHTSMFNNSRTNIIGNYYKGGAQSVAAYGDGSRLGVYLSGVTYNSPQAFVSENRIESVNTDLISGEDNWDNVYEWYTTTDINYTYDQTPYKINSQLSLLGEPINILSANSAFNYVLNDVGANKTLDASGNIVNYIDAVDAAYISDALNGTSNTTTQSGYVDNTVEANLTYPTIPNNTRPANYDTDNDGMPDTWETANSLNPNVADDDGYDLSSEYTNVEMFINSVDTVSEIPTITLTGNATMTFNVGDTYTELGATVTDDVDTGLTATITGVQDGALLSVAGTYYVYYNATDSDSNAATQVVRTLIVNGAGGGSSGSVGKSARIRLLMN
jgi:hypothetical protein